MAPDIRALEPAELRAANAVFTTALHFGPLADARWADGEPLRDPSRHVGAFDEGRVIGAAGSFAVIAAVPGGALLPAAAVTWVGVRADRTRRGVLSAMMRHQLADVARRGEVFASLRASEAGIYGRFGYGVASRARSVAVRRSGRGWLPTAPAGGTVRMLERDEIIPVLSALHEKIGLQRPGAISRPAGWWTMKYGTFVRGEESVIAAVHTGAGGDDDGFAIASPRKSDAPWGQQVMSVLDLQSVDLNATAGLWRFLLGLDLVGTLEAHRPVEEPLELMLADPRDCATTALEDETWLRIVDVPAALAARSWGSGEPVLLGVHDPLMASNAGVYRIADGTAERVGALDGPDAPELECDIAALAMAYLGDRAPSELVAIGWWTERTNAASARADAAFATAIRPWCGTYF
ncbi:GNAT family N-acetyltransferase [Pseudonocardia sp. GCM10023141]|uniref:GNAT family N-acetyltransferase n=1 Tax=Pseudonocardia sp. GCM10023141 TaxID=3252653 RepID=UPI00360DA928